MGLPNFMKFRHCLFKILKKQNFADGQMDNVKTVYPTTNTVCRGIILFPYLFLCFQPLKKKRKMPKAKKNALSRIRTGDFSITSLAFYQ